LARKNEKIKQRLITEVTKTIREGGKHLKKNQRSTQLVKKMAKTTKVDKQGRILIPKNYREKMGIDEKTSVSIHIMNKRLIIEVFNPNLHKAVEKWKKGLINQKIKAFTVPKEAVSKDPKWFSEEYARKKLGL
jgi:AbrB family looped-hinge helix DNA binding protein